MQTRLRCKHASMSHGSLNVDLTIDENLALKSPHHYLVKLCKTPLMSLRLDSHPKVPSLHLRLRLHNSRSHNKHIQYLFRIDYS
jgi:hypothetical protein